jgi:hypothetical protein|nr:DUF551 domain-containing protein [Klebsiella variicola]
MTSKLTREQLHERARENVKALKLASRQTAFESAREEILADLQLAELALDAMDSEPVAWGNGCDKTVPAALRYLAENERPFGGESRFNAAHLSQLAREIELMAEAPLYRHAQPVPVVEREPIAWLNDAYLARGVIDGEAGSEDAGPGYIPVYREAGPQPAPVVPDDLLSMAASAIEDLLEHTDPNTSYYSGVWADMPGKLRAAMLSAAPQSPGSEPATVPGKWIPVSEQMPDREVDVQVYCQDKKEQMVAYLERNEQEGYFRFATWRTGEGIYCQPTHWMQLPAGPREVKSE